jgi:hypothetical protein
MGSERTPYLDLPHEGLRCIRLLVPLGLDVGGTAESLEAPRTRLRDERAFAPSAVSRRLTPPPAPLSARNSIEAATAAPARRCGASRWFRTISGPDATTDVSEHHAHRRAGSGGPGRIVGHFTPASDAYHRMPVARAKPFPTGLGRPARHHGVPEHPRLGRGRTRIAELPALRISLVRSSVWRPVGAFHARAAEMIGWTASGSG